MLSIRAIKCHILYFRIIIFLVLIFIAGNIFAQKEASVWSMGSGMQLNFQSGDVNYSSFNREYGHYSTICDKNGNLVLYTDGRTIWNSKDEILVNGDDLFESNRTIVPGARPAFVPYPKKEGSYILFYETAPKGLYSITDKKLVFAEIDTNAEGGRGKVIYKNKLLHRDYHHTFSIAGYCDNSYFWLLVDSNDNVDEVDRDRIFFYKIDGAGVHLTPNINDEIDIGNSGNYKFSPNGDKFCFGYHENHSHEIYMMAADFNFLEGQAYNFRIIKSEVYHIEEFSPDSRLLYSFIDNSCLLQTDVRYSSASLIRNSIDTIFMFDSPDQSIEYAGDLQLAPDGKIYFSYTEKGYETRKLGRINYPNKKGKACEVEFDLVDLKRNSYPYFPNFITSFFRDKNPEMTEEVIPDAGPNLKICEASKFPIGTEESGNALFTWIPNSGIADPFSPQTIYSADINHYDLPKTIPLTLRATDGNCWLHFDEMKIDVMPKPQDQPVDGSWSICPYVEQVDYWTKKPVAWDIDEETTLHWMVNGGEIDTIISAESIKVNWWDTNFEAAVGAFAVNSYGCVSDTSYFPVRINVELITETPKGPNQICIADGKNKTYQIRPTNGSEYTWNLDGGNITSGQGSNKIEVDWFAEGIHQITVNETSRTIDTICYGESEPLVVEVINDSLNPVLEGISFTVENNLEISYRKDNLNLEKHHLSLLLKNEFGELTYEKGIYTNLSGNYLLPLSTAELEPATIQLKVINSCNEVFYSGQLETVILSGSEEPKRGFINLNWNRNHFWKSDELTHEIWHSVNGKDGWELVAEIENKTEYNYLLQSLALTHYFRVKEINHSQNTETWSNKFLVEVEESLIIPDVFTPNGDGINDTWEIRKIQFHPFKAALVFNRLGEIVYECKNEFVPWDGQINGNVVQGTYFYQITFDSGETKYGQLTILQ